MEIAFLICYTLIEIEAFNSGNTDSLVKQEKNMSRENINRLRLLASEIRLETMKIIASKGNGHVGGSLSIADVLAVLYGEVMHYDPVNPNWKERDWLVLSKGHAGPAMYAALGIAGYYPKEAAYHLNEAGSDFPSHTDHSKTKGVDITTGSLGQGFSQAIGAALGNRMQNIDSYVYVICGDGECDEGQIWEGAQFAAHYHLDNLIGFVDNNGRQLDGTVEEVMSHGKGIGTIRCWCCYRCLHGLRHGRPYQQDSFNGC